MISFTPMAAGGRALAGHLDTFEIAMYRSLLGIIIVVGGAGGRVLYERSIVIG
ncbi:MAG: hypothetical protein ACNYPI_10815 [Arenicellales bacterium WSBS_2016_MAG_OTU3]